jgi:hypothetical protein
MMPLVVLLWWCTVEAYHDDALCLLLMVYGGRIT